MINVPNRTSNVEIVGEVADNRILIYAKHDKYGANIVEIPISCINEQLAHKIAQLITEARNIGFEQGRRYVANALIGPLP